MSTRTRSVSKTPRMAATTPAAARPVPTPQREVVYDAIREALVLQALPAGEKLSEPAWCERLNVSRTAVREAFARLEAEGMIARAPTAGYVVPELSDEDIKEITEVRLALECAAIERICEQRLASPATLAPLHEACDQQTDLIEAGYMLGAREADRRFHQQIISLAGNQRLIQMYRRAPLPLIHRSMATPDPSRPAQETVAEHRRIIDAIDTLDASKARELLRSHLVRRRRT